MPIDNRTKMERHLKSDKKQVRTSKQHLAPA